MMNTRNASWVFNCVFIEIILVSLSSDHEQSKHNNQDRFVNGSWIQGGT
jgi:hypothetical protein